MNNEAYPLTTATSFKPNQSAYRNSMQQRDFSTFKPPPLIAQSNGYHHHHLPVTVDQLKQHQKLMQQRPIVPNRTNSYLQTKSILPNVKNNNLQLINNGRLIGDQLDGSPSLWRSKSFAGLQQPDQLTNNNETATVTPINKNVQKQQPKISLRQAPITFANQSAATNRNTIHLGKQFDDKMYTNNNLNNNHLPANLTCNQNCCKNAKQEIEQSNNKLAGSNNLNNNLNKVNDEISQRYLAAAENNFNAANGLNKMRHSQSHHSYLANAPNPPINTFNTGTLPNSISFHGQQLKPGSLDASSLSSIGSSGSGSLTRSKFN